MIFKLNHVIPAGGMRLVAMEIQREGMPIYAVIDVLSQQVLCTALSAEYIMVMLVREVRARAEWDATILPQNK